MYFFTKAASDPVLTIVLVSRPAAAAATRLDLHTAPQFQFSDGFRRWYREVSAPLLRLFIENPRLASLSCLACAASKKRDVSLVGWCRPDHFAMCNDNEPCLMSVLSFFLCYFCSGCINKRRLKMNIYNDSFRY